MPAEYYEHFAHNLNVNFFYVPPQNATFQVSTICIKERTKNPNERKQEQRDEKSDEEMSFASGYCVRCAVLLMKTAYV